MFAWLGARVSARVPSQREQREEEGALQPHLQESSQDIQVTAHDFYCGRWVGKKEMGG